MEVKMAEQEMKKEAGYRAAETLVKSGMKLGLGTGSTAIHAIRRVGELLAEGKLKGIRVFPTSFQSVIECEKLGIPQYSLNSPELSGNLDLTIDGADEIDPQGRCIKGGGGALLLEKIAAYASLSYALVADERKSVPSLGSAFAVPVETVIEARLSAAKELEKLGAAVTLREAVRKAGPVITEHGNILLDIRFPSPVDPEFMESAINRIPGVVENGFFAAFRERNIKVTVFVAHGDGAMEIRE
jgi:ribose 5-phosphate isomerase A